MINHLILLSHLEVEEIRSGKLEYLVRFFKKRLGFLKEIAPGDLVYFRKSRGEILGQFVVGKVIITQKLDVGDWDWIKEVGKGKWDLKKEEFIKKINENSIMLIIQINNLEQLITSPIEIDKRSKKEWIVLE